MFSFQASKISELYKINVPAKPLFGVEENGIKANIHCQMSDEQNTEIEWVSRGSNHPRASISTVDTTEPPLATTSASAGLPVHPRHPCDMVPDLGLI